MTQWDKWLVVPKTTGQEYHIYYYDLTLTNPEDRLTTIYTSTSSAKADFEAPKIDQISSDGNYASFSLFKCWNCQDNSAETILWYAADNTTKNIGRVTDFAWLNGGGYQYKTYTAIPCVNPGATECSVDPQTLPLQIGQY